jgi:hypothetical protein
MQLSVGAQAQLATLPCGIFVIRMLQIGHSSGKPLDQTDVFSKSKQPQGLK